MPYCLGCAIHYTPLAFRFPISNFPISHCCPTHGLLSILFILSSCLFLRQTVTNDHTGPRGVTPLRKRCDRNDRMHRMHRMNRMPCCLGCAIHYTPLPFRFPISNFPISHCSPTHGLLSILFILSSCLFLRQTVTKDHTGPRGVAPLRQRHDRIDRMDRMPGCHTAWAVRYTTRPSHSAFPFPISPSPIVAQPTVSSVNGRSRTDTKHHPLREDDPLHTRFET